MTRRKIVILGSLGVLVLCLGAGYLWLHRPFDGDAWRDSSPESGSTVRYRMRDSLIATMRAEHWTMDRAMAELGPVPGVGTGNPNAIRTIDYSLGHGVDGQGWTLELRFDPAGVFEEAEVHPE